MNYDCCSALHRHGGTTSASNGGNHDTDNFNNEVFPINLHSRRYVEVKNQRLTCL